MDRQERAGWVMVCLAFMSWGAEIYSKWPVLATQLTIYHWIPLAGFPLVVLGSLWILLINARRNAQSRGPILFVTSFVILSWAFDFSLMGKIGH